MSAAVVASCVGHPRRRGSRNRRTTVFAGLAGLALIYSRSDRADRCTSTVESVSVTLRRALRAQRFTSGLVLLAIGSMLFGVLSVLAPCILRRRVECGGNRRNVARGVRVRGFRSPFIGRLSDTRGAMTPRVWLSSPACGLVALATGASPIIYAPLWCSPAWPTEPSSHHPFSLVSEGAESAGLAQGRASA